MNCFDCGTTHRFKSGRGGVMEDTELDTAYRLIDRLTAELEKAREELEQQKKWTEFLPRQNEEFRKRIQEMSEELEKAHGKISELEKEKEIEKEITKDYWTMFDELDKAKERVGELESFIEGMIPRLKEASGLINIRLKMDGRVK